MKTMNFLKNINRKIILGGVILSIPVFAIAGELIFRNADTNDISILEKYSYDSVDFSANGRMVINLARSTGGSSTGGSSTGGSSTGGSSTGGSSTGGSSTGGSSTGGSSTGGSSTGGSSTGGSSTGGSSSSEYQQEITNAVSRYHNEYFNKGAYSSKNDLHHWKDGGNTVYVVNRGEDGTSIPSCVNGKAFGTSCRPTGWTIGVKQNEVYALRLMVEKDYSYAGIRTEINSHDGGKARSAVYDFVLSDKPGDMSKNYFEGECSYTHVDSGGITLSSSKNDIISDCYVPNTAKVIYLNLKLKSDQKHCEKEVCSGFILLNGFLTPEALDVVIK